MYIDINMVFTNRTDILNKRGKRASDIAHNIHISRMINRSKEKYKRLDYFDSFGRKTSQNFYNELKEDKDREHRKSVSHLFKAINTKDIAFIKSYFCIKRQDGKENIDLGTRLPGSTGDRDDKADSVNGFEIITSEGVEGNNVKDGANGCVDVFGPEGMTPLHAASRIGSIEIVQYLLSIGACVQLRYVPFVKSRRPSIPHYLVN